MGRSLLPAIAVGTLMAGAASAAVIPPLFNAPGIPAAGFPDFTNNNVSLVFSKIGGDYVMAAYGTAGAFNLTSSKSYGVNNEVFAMYATFNGSGGFLSGGETIFGSIPGLTNNSFQNLYTVAFDKSAVSTSTIGLGFESVDSTASGWASKYQTSNESLYLYAAALAPLDNALKSGHGLPAFFTARVSEFTTVPLPAAAWLLGPAFAGLIAGARRRRQPGGAADEAGVREAGG